LHYVSSVTYQARYNPEAAEGTINAIIKDTMGIHLQTVA
jgi:hypothetical protein